MAFYRMAAKGPKKRQQPPYLSCSKSLSGGIISPDVVRAGVLS